MRRIFLLLFCLFSTDPALAALTPAGNALSATSSGQVLHVTLANASLDVHVLAPNLVRFRWTQNARFDDSPSFAVVARRWPATPFSLRERADEWEIDTAELHVHIRKQPCRIRIEDAAGNLLNQDDPTYGTAFDRGQNRCYKTLLPHERFFGLGEKTGNLERTGNEYVMWNSDVPGYGEDQDPLYVSIPFYIGWHDSRAYGIFLDNPWRTVFNMGAGNDRFAWFGSADGDLDYYFIGGPLPARVLQTYTALTGRMPLPPRWALGFQQSRWSYYPESRVREIAGEFRRRRIPCDTIYLDIDYMDGYRVFTWDRQRFADAAHLLKDLAAQGFKVVPIIDPGVKADAAYAVAREGLERKLFATYPDGSPYRGEVWPSWAYFPDFTRSATSEWWGEKIGGLLDVGVAGIWNDMNEPSVWGRSIPEMVRFGAGDMRKVHNVYGLCMARATYEAEWGRRPFILSRAGFAGIQRYAANWTGDNLSTETHLRLAATMPQSMGLSGLPFVGSDVGGFIGSPSPELYARWMQLGAFTPFFRAHSAKETPSKEPWALGAQTEALARAAIELRYRLLPYLYECFRESSESGLPVMRPMLLEFPQDENCWAADAHTQFMLGNALLVAPVLAEHERSRKLYLPRGRWKDWWSGQVLEGGRWVSVDAPLERIPLFLREGCGVALRDVQQFEGEHAAAELEVRMFPDRHGNASTLIYDDDGSSFAYQRGAYRLTRVEVNHGVSRVRVLHDGYHGGTYRLRVLP